MNGVVYKITNTVNNKVYIGVTIRDPQIRWKEHLRGCHNFHLNQSIKLYGKENFTFEILCEVDIEELGQKEKFYISRYEATNPPIKGTMCQLVELFLPGMKSQKTKERLEAMCC